MASRQFRTDDTSTWNDLYGNGSDGTLTISSNTTDSTANTTLTGTSGSTSATAGSGTGFAANNLVLIHQSQGTGVGTWELNKISSVGGGTNWTMVYTLTNTYGTGAQVYLLKQYSAVTVNGSTTLTSSSWNGTKGGIIALLCNGTTTITGTCSLVGTQASAQTGGAGIGFSGGAGNFNQVASNYGEGTTGASAQSSTGAANGNGGGGGKGSADATNNGGTGGGGGNGVIGGDGSDGGGGSSYHGTGGGTAGAASLVTMVFGGGGGGGGVGSSISSATRGTGGGGGGGIIVIISTTISITGSINLNGGAGDPATTSIGGGGGAGGSCLLKGNSVTIGTNLITATGGTGQGGSDNGGAGRIHIDFGTTLSGSTNSPAQNSSQDSILVPATSTVDTSYSYILDNYKSHRGGENYFYNTL